MEEKIILYASNYAPLRKLSPERKAVLFDSVFRYALGEELPEMDEITELAWGFLQNALDHTRDKIEEIRQKRSEAGKRHKGNQYGTNGTSVPSVEQTEQDGTNGTINITKHNITERNVTEHNITATGQNKNLPDYVARTEDVTELADRYIASQAFEAFAVANNVTRPRAEQLLKRFVLHLQSTDDTSKTWRDFCSHFASWARYELPRLNEETARPAIPSAFLNPEPL